MSETTVLLTSDGTYPCYRGGVSVWCDQLIRHLADVRFHVFAITYSPSDLPLFNPPPNLASCRLFPLWGTEEAGRVDSRFSETYQRKDRTTTDSIGTEFLGAYRQAVGCLITEDSHPEKLAEALTSLHDYFQEYDYSRSMTSAQSWDVFLDLCATRFGEPGLTLGEATTCMRWLHRYLAVLSVQYPSTDVVHASIAGLAGIPGVLASRRGAKFILSEHGIFLRELYLTLSKMKHSIPCKRFLLRLSQAVFRMNVHFADTVTSLCVFNQKWQIRLGVDPHKLRIAPNGVDPAIFTPRPVEARERPIILAMARVFRLKGIDHLLRAAALVRDRYPNVRFRILGDVADEVYYKECLEIVACLNLSDWVEFGQTRNSAAAYNDADIFCLSSISEGMPFSVLEAMFSGVPVVATDVGGIAEMVGDTGIVVKPADSRALAEALLSLLEGDQAESRRRNYAFAGLSRARARYDIRTCIDSFRRLYAGSGKLSDASGLHAA